MSILDLIAMLRRRLAYLDIQRKSALPVGDIAQVDLIDAEMAEIQTAINKLEA